MTDKALFIAVMALLTISLIATYSLSTFTVLYYGYGDFHFFTKQLIAVIVGVGAIYLLSGIDPDRWFLPIGFTIFIVSFIAMLFMPFMPESLVKSVLGAKRWIHIGFISIAPVEFFKIGFVFFIAWSFSRRVIHHGKLPLSDELKIIAPYLFVLGVAIVMIAIFQKDLGQTVLIAITLLFLFIMAGRSLKLFAFFIVLGLLAVVVLILAAPHRVQRIRSWWSTVQDGFLGFFPSEWVSYLRVPEVKEPYQISNSLNSICNGGYFGQGLGDGQFKLGYLSEVHTDFILSGLSEELGYIGLFLVTSLTLFIIARLFIIASRLQRSDYYLFTVGVALTIVFAFIINSYGISGITPIKGIAVPFLSYGGSQIIANCISIGMVLMISKKADKDLSKTDSDSDRQRAAKEDKKSAEDLRAPYTRHS